MKPLSAGSPKLPDIPSYEEFAESKRRKLLSHIDLTWLERDEYQTKRNSELAESWAIRFKVAS